MHVSSSFVYRRRDGATITLIRREPLATGQGLFLSGEKQMGFEKAG